MLSGNARLLHPRLVARSGLITGRTAHVGQPWFSSSQAVQVFDIQPKTMQCPAGVLPSQLGTVTSPEDLYAAPSRTQRAHPMRFNCPLVGDEKNIDTDIPALGASGPRRLASASASTPGDCRCTTGLTWLAPRLLELVTSRGQSSRSMAFVSHLAGRLGPLRSGLAARPGPGDLRAELVCLVARRISTCWGCIPRCKVRAPTGPVSCLLQIGLHVQPFSLHNDLDRVHGHEHAAARRTGEVLATRIRLTAG